MEYKDCNNQDKKISDELKKEVIDKYDNDDMQLFILKGDPINTEEMSKGIDAKDIIYGYIVIAHKIVEVPSEKINYIIQKFKNKESLYADDVKGLRILFEFPLFDKQKYGNFNQLFRNDEYNINHVNELQPYKKKIGESIIDVGIYSINSLHNGGDESMTFTPYIGITEYTYNHRGTTNKYIINLKEYKINE